MKKRKSTIKDLEKRVKKLETLVQEITIKINQSYKRRIVFPQTIPSQFKITPGIIGKGKISITGRRKIKGKISI